MKEASEERQEMLWVPGSCPASKAVPMRRMCGAIPPLPLCLYVMYWDIFTFVFCCHSTLTITWQAACLFDSLTCSMYSKIQRAFQDAWEKLCHSFADS
jgi:hypothetical protein